MLPAVGICGILMSSLIFAKQSQTAKIQKQAAEAYSHIDVDNDGCVERSELKKYLSNKGMCDDNEFNEILATIDKNNDGFIDQHEFFEVYRHIHGNFLSNIWASAKEDATIWACGVTLAGNAACAAGEMAKMNPVTLNRIGIFCNLVGACAFFGLAMQLHVMRVQEQKRLGLLLSVS